MNKDLSIYLIGICLSLLASVYIHTQYGSISTNIDNIDTDQKKENNYWSTKKSKVKSGEDTYMKPDGFIEYFNSISKRVDQETSDYINGYRFKELSKSISSSAQARVANLNAEFKSRGPGNVGGRTRAIAVDPADNTNCTWIAGAASGGLWKTVNCGETWENISPALPNLSTNSIAQAASNPNVIYVGTGEVFARNSSFVRGEGIYKSIDRGATWNFLPSTVNDDLFQSVNRIQIDPNNENIVIIATNEGVFKSIDGGNNWTQTYNSPDGTGAAYRAVQDLQVDPSDFNIQYAGVNGLGILKSTDAGTSWNLSSAGISEGVRFEIAVSSSNPNILYTSTFSGSNTLLYYSEDKAQNWVLVDDPDYNTNFLGAQGWYDNTIAINPYNPYEVFVGGVSIGKYVIDPNNIGESDRRYLGTDFENTEFLSFVNFGADFENGTINISTGNLEPSQNPMTVEIRFGGLNSQKAHRFTVPADGGTNGDGGAGISESDYTYQDYIDVPFEVWDIENNRQLMVSFRDQERNGEFNLNPRDDTNDPDLLTAREYLYIHDIAYDPNTANSSITDQAGGIAYANMYYFWPILASGANWDPASFNNAIMRLNYGSQFVAAALAVAVYDAYGSYENQNQNNLHPDHHHLTFIKMNDANETFMIVNGNDGGLGISTDNGEVITQITDGYVTTQFYGADKKPGEEKYIGGTQDNGTWVSTSTTVDETNAYNFVIGGDGFEVLWHPTDTDLVLGTIYNNRIRKSTNGGQSFSASASGITTDDGPFITRLAGSSESPNTVFAIGGIGVYKSTDFGSSWTIKTIDNPAWGGNASANDLEVSLANSNIVWAGAGMADFNFQLKFFVSTDGGESFQPVNNYSTLPNAFSTGIYTHPIDENTAYALFSRANFPKILRTTDLGQTWEDISGFEGNNGVSNRGFPDVFVHSLLVMPFDTNVIWAGTEIGLYESLDGGQSWNIRNDIPSVSIWSMKLVDDEVVFGTHGRGIWTATIEELAKTNLKVDAFSYLGYGDADISVDLPVRYDQVKVLINNVEVAILEAPASGINTVSITDFYENKGADIKVLGTLGNEVFESAIFTLDEIDLAPQILNFETSIDGDIYPVLIELENNEPFDKVEVYFGDKLVHTDQQVLTKTDEKRIINFDYDKVERNTLHIRAYIRDEVYISNGGSEIITSNNQVSDDDIRVFPNPTSNYLNISSKANSVHDVKIYSTNGVLIDKITVNSYAKSTQIDLRSLTQGSYLLQILGQDGRMVSKRIVKD
ncbi:T9SS type A sorting domain-containing protein [Marivirga sp.]|uniref:T9SS type A sorting domain-containing protein n=1 Tax=Marivirga sp. TaxID=2018662 RepID=UPI0025CC6681|nr:T9SS type A sorting domain-containing protein [Marivirga sp.]